MFDIGGLELLVIAVVALVVIGPKELPGTLRTVAFWVRRARSMAREFQSGFEELTREAELDELRREVNAAIEKDPFDDAAHGVRETVEHSIGPEIYSDLDSSYPGSPAEDGAPAPEHERERGTAPEIERQTPPDAEPEPQSSTGQDTAGPGAAAPEAPRKGAAEG